MNRLGRLEYEQGNGFEIPLYTHPVKELTDEEIQALWTVKHPNVMSLNPDLLEFAKAILKKAQEK